MEIGSYLYLGLFVLLIILGVGYTMMCCGLSNVQPVENIVSVKLKAIFNNGLSVCGADMTIIARNDQVITFKPVFEDDYGNEASALGSIPVWSVSDEAVATIAVSEDGMQAVVTPTGKKGDCQVNMLVDADPSADEVPLVGTADITVMAGMARVVRLTGVLADKPTDPVETPQEPEVQPQSETPAEPEVATEPVQPEESTTPTQP